ncbi:MAG: TatD family hydrolase [Flavobacteriales bacterium]|nr:TatD family hydrolase [Flavobacteriales bacterium]
MHQLVDLHPELFVPMIGLHPCSVKENWKEELVIMEENLGKNEYCAIGEIGVDLYWDKTTLNIQQQAFAEQIEWAKERALPIVIHARDSFEAIFEVVDSHNDESLQGVFHCFTGTLDQAEKVLDYGDFYLGIGGVSTFKNGGMDKVLPHVSLDHLMLETDSPYLAPVPHRGKRNESSYVRLVLDRIAELKQVPAAQVAEATTSNAKKLFNLS